MSAPLQMNVNRQLAITIVPKNTKTASWWLESSVFAIDKIANLSVRIEYMCAELWMDIYILRTLMPRLAMASAPTVGFIKSSANTFVCGNNNNNIVI